MTSSRKNISIRLKIILTVLFSILLLVTFVYVISTKVLLESYLSIERDDVIEDVTRAESVLKGYSSALDIKLRDWAMWDDSYDFVQNANTEFLETNLQDPALINLEISLLMYVNINKEVIFQKTLDPATGIHFNGTPLTDRILSEERLVIHKNEGSKSGGMLQVGDTTFLIQSLPVMTSLGEGPIAGTMLFGKTLDENLISDLKETSHLNLQIFPYDSQSLPSDVKAAKSRFETSQPYITEPLSESSIAGYGILYDINRTPINIIRIESPREVYNQGKNTIGVFIFIASASILLFGIVMLLTLEKLLIQRFARLSYEVTQINSIEHLSSLRIDEGKHDEIGMLAEKINQMLALLFASRKKEEELTELERKAVDALKEHSNEVEKTNKLMVNRELKMIELKKEIDVLKQKLAEK